jgi:hypothetical protein
VDLIVNSYSHWTFRMESPFQLAFAGLVGQSAQDGIGDRGFPMDWYDCPTVKLCINPNLSAAPLAGNIKSTSGGFSSQDSRRPCRT